MVVVSERQRVASRARSEFPVHSAREHVACHYRRASVAVAEVVAVRVCRSAVEASLRAGCVVGNRCSSFAEFSDDWISWLTNYMSKNKMKSEAMNIGSR